MYFIFLFFVFLVELIIVFNILVGEWLFVYLIKKYFCFFNFCNFLIFFLIGGIFFLLIIILFGIYIKLLVENFFFFMCLFVFGNIDIILFEFLYVKFFVFWSIIMVGFFLEYFFIFIGFNGYKLCILKKSLLLYFFVILWVGYIFKG